MIRSLRDVDMLDILEVRPRRRAVDLDDSREAALLENTERLRHRPGYHLELLLIHGRIGREHHEEGHQEAHQVREGDEPAVAAGMTLLALGHGPCLRLP